jgi:N-methylhydantoinase A/oxoprolinase/acetone carboxylase beta subunit
MSGKPVTCGHHLSSELDAPRRALTALLNARLIPMINALLTAARELLRQRNINSPLMIVKGDGSLVSDDFASQYPVETILSGPAASVVGARFLCQQASLLVSDMGGTTTDIALVRDDEPLLNQAGAVVGGWRTMVKAVDVRTYGLGGDSAVVYDLESRSFKIGPQRVMPLSLFAHLYPESLDVLEEQLSLPFSTTHSAQFVMKHAADATGLSAQQSELLGRIEQRPIALQTLFSDQTLDRALMKLEQKGIVLRAGFTPTDASHLLARQSTWDNRAAGLGARLLMRYCADNLGQAFKNEKLFALSVAEQVSQHAAIALLDTAFSQETNGQELSSSQIDLIKRGFDNFQSNESNGSNASLVSMNAHLNVPVAALGAPSKSYYSRVTDLLGTTMISPEYADVANAIGAVVGVIRQEVVITIQAAGGKRVSVLFPDGSQEFDTLEEGAAAATLVCEKLAIEKSNLAGAADCVVQTKRIDNVVTQAGETVFFDSRITSTAVGRPTSAA